MSKVTKKCIFSFAFLLAVQILLGVACSSSSAHSGDVAIAESIPGVQIEIDGELDDWPQPGRRNAIARNHYGDAPESPSDLSAWFRAIYDQRENKLYLCVQVTDDSFVEQVESPLPKKAGAVEDELDHPRFDAASFCFSLQHLHGESPASSEFFLPCAISDQKGGVTGCSSRSGKLSSYEWMIDLGDRETNGFSGQHPLTASFCCEVWDVDEDNSISKLFWVLEGDLPKSANRTGDLMLLPSGTKSGVLIGRLSDEIGHNPFGSTLIHLQSIEHPHLTVDVISDSDGRFQSQLPVGKYVRTVRHIGPEKRHVVLEADTKTMDEVIICPFRQPVSLGQGRAIRTGTTTKAWIYDVHKRRRFRKLEFTSQNGVYAEEYRDVAVDPKGSVWVASSSGLIELNGYETITFDENDGLPSKSIRRVKILRDTLWIGFENGLAALNLETRRLTCITELSGKHIYTMDVLHDGRIGIGTNRGLFCFDVKRDVVVAVRDDNSPTERCLAICADPTGNFSWVGSDHGVKLFDGERLERHLGPHMRLKNNRFWEIAADSRGGIWFGTHRSVFCLADNKLRVLYESGHRIYRHWTISEDRHGAVWVGSYAKTDRVASDSLPMLAYRSAKELAAHRKMKINSQAFAFDEVGNLWVCEPDRIGVIDLGHKELSRYFCPLVTESGNELWCSTQHSDFKRWQVHHIVDGQYMSSLRRVTSPSEVTAVMVDPHDSKTVWLGTKRHGLRKFDTSRWDTDEWKKSNRAERNRLVADYPGRPSSRRIDALAMGDDGKDMLWPVSTRVFDIKYFAPTNQIWCATGNGVYVIENGMTKHVYSQNSGLPTSQIESIEQYRDNQVICGSQVGVLILDQATGKLLQQLGVKDGLPAFAAPIVKVTVDDSIWIGTHQGLFRYANGTMADYTKRAPLLQSRVRRIKEDRQGYLWFVSSMGVTKHDPQTEVFQTFHRPSDAAPNELFMDVATQNGDTWVASNRGLVRRVSRRSTPRLKLQFIETDRLLAKMESIQTDSDSHSVHLGFQAVARATDADSFVYRYRLRGFDDWQTTAQPTIRYTTPSIGKYTFEVVAYDQDLNRSNLLSVPYMVTPPYARWWQNAVVVASLLACALFGVLYTIKVKRANRELARRVTEETQQALMAHDQTQELEKQLFQAQKMESLGTMAAGIAHDFNNALCAIVTNAQLGLLPGAGAAAKSEALSSVVTASRQAASFTKSLLTFAGKSAVEKHPVKIDTIIGESLDMVGATLPSSIQVGVHLPDTPVWCDADDGQLKQVFVNLVVNSRDAMPNGGRIELEVWTEPDDVYDTVAIRVKDNGCGIDPGTQRRIFEPFFTQKSRGKGTGLGLSIVQSIIKAHDGEIEVCSEVGEGTTFDIRIPTCCPPNRGAEKSTSDPPAVRSRGGKIVIADDDRRVRTTLSEALTSLGFDVVKVSDGRELVDTAGEMLDQISLVVADIDMPNLDGLSAARELRRSAPDLPIVFITGLHSELGDDLSGPFTVFLSKPFSLDVLSKHVRELTNRTVEVEGKP